VVRRALDLLELAGGVLIVVGVALYAVPLALIVAGLFLVIAASSMPGPKGAASSPPTTGTGRRPRRVA